MPPNQIDPPKAYSYVRFSTPEQARGDSKRRRIDKATEYALRRGLDLVSDEYMDFGVSAYRGRNSEDGALADFLSAVEDGAIEQGAYLLVESLDRISREKPRKAVRLLEDICDAGITLVTLGDGKEYSADRLNNDPMAFMWAYMIAIRANEESEVKAQRLREAWRKKRELAASENVPLTSRTPAWLRLSQDGRQFEQIEERVAVIRKIFREADRGMGQHAIAQMLNREGVETFGDGPRKAAFWHRSYVAKILSNPAVHGTLIPHVTREGRGQKVRDAQAPIPGYYPRIVAKALFDRVNGRRRGGNTPRMNGQNAQVSNVLAGLAKCPECGGTMTRVNKGRKGGPPVLVCTAAKAGAGCSYRSVRLPLIEAAIRHAGPRQLTHDVPSGDPEINDKVIDLSKAMEGVDSAISNILEEIEGGGGSLALRRRLAELEEIAAQQRDDWSELQASAAQATGRVVERTVDKLAAATANPKATVTELNKVLRDAMQQCVVDYHSGRLIFHWKHSPETTSIYYDIQDPD